MGDARRRRSLALQTPKNIRNTTPRVRRHAPVETRLCLMAQMGKCQTSFHVLGNPDQFMCHDHWRHVNEELRTKLAEGFVAIKAEHERWQTTQRAAMFAVLAQIAPQDAKVVD